jgi:hypothetical protein
VRHCKGTSETWARLLEEIITSKSWRPLLRAAMLILISTPAAVAVALLVLFLSH